MKLPDLSDVTEERPVIYPAFGQRESLWQRDLRFGSHLGVLSEELVPITEDAMTLEFSQEQKCEET